MPPFSTTRVEHPGESLSNGVSEDREILELMGLSPKTKRVKPQLVGRGWGTRMNRERPMRLFRLALPVPNALGALALLSSPASASTIPTQLSIGQVQLGPWRIRFGRSHVHV